MQANGSLLEQAHGMKTCMISEPSLENKPYRVFLDPWSERLVNAS